MKKLLLNLSISFFVLFAHAQNVGIGTASPKTKLNINGAISIDEATAPAAAAVTIPNDKSLFRLTVVASVTANALSIVTPQEGQFLTIRNEDGDPATFAGFTIEAGRASTFLYNNVAWRLASDDNTGDWKRKGNAGTTATIYSDNSAQTNNFIGTTDNIPVSVYTNSASTKDKTDLRLYTSTASGNAIAANTDIMHIRRNGENGVSYPQVASFALGKHTAGTNSLTSLSIKLGNGGVYVPDVTVMTLNSNGNVGIGVTTPAYKFEIATSASFGWGDGTDGSYKSRTESRANAGLRGDAGAQSGFFQTSAPSPATNWPTNEIGGSTSWQHLIDIRHSNPANNYAMQIAGSFFDQDLFVRKTNDNPAQSWSRMVTSRDIVYVSQDDAPGFGVNAWNTVSGYTGNMDVRTGDVIKFDGAFLARLQGGDNNDYIYWRVLIENVSGCTTTNTPQMNYFQATEASADHDNFKPVPIADVWVANCNGTVRFAIQTYFSGDDNGQVYSRRLIATRY